jgi:hypothetical protein
MKKIICIWIPGGIESAGKDGMSKEAGKDTRSVERQVWKTQDGMFQLACWANRVSLPASLLIPSLPAESIPPGIHMQIIFFIENHWE